MSKQEQPWSEHPPLSRRIRLRHLELLAALAAQSSLKSAASSLDMTQPAATKLLAEVETLVGTQLFERTYRGVQPTDAGCALIRRAQRLIGSVDSIEEELRALAAGATGIVRVGVYPACGALIPQAISRMKARQMNVLVRIEESSANVLLDALREGRLDCVVGRVLDSQDVADFNAVHLYHESITTVCRPDHPLLQQASSAWSDALKYDWILPPHTAPLRRTLRSWFDRNGISEPRCVLESTSTFANLALVREGDTLAFFGSTSAVHFSDQGLVSIVPLLLDGVALPSVSLLLPKDDVPHPPITDFIAALQAVSSER